MNLPRLNSWTATVLYAMAAVAMTWPLAPGLARDIPWDLGDSLLNCWILAWDAAHLIRFFTGDVGALAEYWHANIFHPEPLALAYSEHLTAQAIQILPVYAATGNIALSYNLIFLSTFVLSGLGVFLLVRSLTGHAAAAFVAGLFYAFAPYRIGQFSHIQILSSQWMPFALFGLRRFFETRRVAPLAGATSAIIAQNLSCGYFLVYFAPFAAAYAIYEMAVRKIVGDLRVWGRLIGAAVVTLVVTWPFLAPYVELRAAGFPPRPLAEVDYYAADVYSYLTAHGAERVWGNIMRAFPKPEGDLFPGIVPIALALVGFAFHVHQWRRRSATGADDPSLARAWRPAIRRLAFVVMVAYFVMALVILTTGGVSFRIGAIPIRAVNLSRALRVSAIAGIVLLALSRRARLFAAGMPASAFGFYLGATMAAFAISLGPTPRVLGTPMVVDSPYRFLYSFVPGFDGLRVPARVGMLVALFLSVLGGYGAAALEQRWRSGRRWILAAGVLFLFEATSAPIVLNSTWGVTNLEPPAGRMLVGAERPPVYAFLATLPAEAAIVEMPFGEDQYELRYMVYSSSHWRPLLNGYSGGVPPSYVRLRATLRTVLTEPDRAWTTLIGSAATHVVVHENIYLPGDGPRVSDWLMRHGARDIARFGSDRVFALPSR